jgi:hypothetical protein
MKFFFGDPLAQVTQFFMGDFWSGCRTSIAANFRPSLALLHHLLILSQHVLDVEIPLSNLDTFHRRAGLLAAIADDEKAKYGSVC